MKNILGFLTGLYLAFQTCTAVSALSSTPHGYGQGKEKDGNNCPLGASDFNSVYGQFNSYALSEDKSNIILTFDQGYENGYTARILDTLKEKNVKAIFFLTGDYAKKETELVQRMIDEGHVLGNHGMTHAKFPELTDEGLRKEISSLHDYVLEKYDYQMQYLRPPCGEFSEKSLEITKSLGYKTIMWSFAYVDWNADNQPAPEEALNKMLDSAHGGAIYLLHSVSSTNAEVLGQMIDGLREKGYIL
ncbi:MAG: polysaccharide deacetylase family protein [Oscillospiraceae bacterium]|nr:polysaccharide deacetylase family protein [Oscillospiraceae bacterium]